MIYRITLFFLWIFIWLILTWPPTIKQLIAGAVISVFVSLLTMDLLVPRKSTGANGSLKNICVRIGWFLLYIAIFLWECIKGNIDVAYRVLHPDLPIRPGTIKIKTALKSDLGLTFLANSLTLTPGRTTVDVDKEKGFLYMHKLFIKKGDSALKDAVADKFEKILVRIFE